MISSLPKSVPSITKQGHLHASSICNCKERKKKFKNFIPPPRIHSPIDKTQFPTSMRPAAPSHLPLKPDIIQEFMCSHKALASRVMQIHIMTRSLRHVRDKRPRPRELGRREPGIGVSPGRTLGGEECSVARAVAHDGVVGACDVHYGTGEGGQGVAFRGKDLADGEGFGELRGSVWVLDIEGKGGLVKWNRWMAWLTDSSHASISASYSPG